MKTKRLLLVTATTTLFIGLGTSVALAGHDRILPSMQPMATIVENLQAQGYKTIYDVDFDDGVYKVDVLNNKGQHLKLRIDATSAKVVAPKALDDKAISMLDAIKTVQAAGYSHIHDIELEHGPYGYVYGHGTLGPYKIEARNTDGEKVDIFVDAHSNKIIRTVIDD